MNKQSIALIAITAFFTLLTMVHDPELGLAMFIITTVPIGFIIIDVLGGRR